MDKEKKDLLVFGGVFTGVWGFLFVHSFLKEGWTAPGLFFLVVSVMMLALVLFKRDWLAVVKAALARIVHPVGQAVTALALALVFYLIFTPVAIILKIFGKDLLGEKAVRLDGSYWHLRCRQPFIKENYLRQF